MVNYIEVGTTLEERELYRLLKRRTAGVSLEAMGNTFGLDIELAKDRSKLTSLISSLRKHLRVSNAPENIILVRRGFYILCSTDDQRFQEAIPGNVERLGKQANALNATKRYYQSCLE